MELKLKMYLVDQNREKFMGIGVLWLLQEIVKERSIRGAAANLGLSYSKAHNMLRVLEKDVGQPVLERRKGGDNRDGAVITPFGRQLIRLYDEFQLDVKQYADRRFEQFREMLSKEIDHVDRSL